MEKQLSKSVLIMFLFDLIVFLLSTTFWYDYFKMPFFYGIPILLIMATGLISLFLKANYKIREFNITTKNTYLLFEGIVFAHIPALLLLVWVNGLTLEKFLLANTLTIFLILRIYRALFHYYLFNLKKVKNILILGADKRARTIADEIQAKKALRMNVAGFVQDKSDNEKILWDVQVPVYKNVENLAEIIKEKAIDIVVIAQPTELIITVPPNVKLYKMPDFYEMVTGKYYIDEKTITELYYQLLKSRSISYEISKRLLDIISAIIILTITLPITLLTAIVVYLTDNKNPIYTQTRITKGGKSFKCYKLRTMYSNTYIPKNLDKGGYSATQETDDRVIPFCKIIRKARFDEIPQMINIIVGDMSIVGPRAEWEEVVKIYKEQIPYYKSRMWVKTGWTGWAQINQGHCINNEDVAEKLQYDLYYLKNRTILMDFFILIKAIFLALGSRHA